MNNKKAKESRRHAKSLIVKWLREMLEPKQAELVTLNNYEKFFSKSCFWYWSK